MLDMLDETGRCRPTEDDMVFLIDSERNFGTPLSEKMTALLCYDLIRWDGAI
jgi:hypothetical protein